MITTLEYANRLKNAGCDEKVANELAALHGEITQESLNNNVTKKYLIDSLKDLEQRLIIKLGGLMIAGMSILGFILKH